ncbi:MAG TPA: SulP family inorganic anion transporter [Vicinamibacteria bacterium]|nr:SulP family inorganic anion transporter [Vicinamibacteria bacterium]
MKAPIRADLIAGLTVALVGLPQCLAYAMMSGLPPAYGIATAAVPGLVAALVGRSAQVVTGPTNTTGLLILSALFPFLGANGLIGADGLPVLATLTLLAGVTRLVVGYAGGETLLRFLPESVLVGFTAGAGVLIATMQLDEALGLPPVRETGLAGEFAAVASSFREGTYPALPAVLVTVGVVLVLVLGRRFLPRVPIALVSLLVISVGAWALALDQSTGVPLVGDRAPVPKGWPETALPTLRLDLLHDFFVPALAITLLGSLELAVTARARGARPDMKREILAQGWANIAGAFSGAFPASASLTRSALLQFVGARTRLAAASAAIFVLPILLIAAPSVAYIPQAALAGVLFVTAFGMIDRVAMSRMWRASAATRSLLVVTLTSTLVLPLEWAILLGAGLGLVIHLARTSIPRVRLLTADGPKERIRPIGPEDEPAVVIVEVSGDLHYAAAEPFLAEVEHKLPSSARVVIMDLSHAHEMRFTALLTLERFASDLERRDVRLHLAGVPKDVYDMLRATGSRLRAVPAEAEPYLSVRKCLALQESEGSEPDR